jgi:hypothetical protein
LPSIIISESPVVNDIIELLKTQNSEAKQLFDYLPTLPSILRLIEILTKKNSFDFSALLHRYFPSLFVYGLEFIIDNFNDSMIFTLQQSN